MEENKPSLTYQDAGVSIETGNALIDRIKPHAKGADKLGSWFAALKPVQIVQALKVEV